MELVFRDLFQETFKRRGSLPRSTSKLLEAATKKLKSMERPLRFGV